MEKTKTFKNRSDAWRFMYACDEAGWMAGFPDWKKDGTYTVRYIITASKTLKAEA